MLSLLFAILFGLSLLPGRKPLCLRFAERVSDGIMPDGAARYCTRLTWVWFGLLSFVTAVNLCWLLCYRGACSWLLPTVLPLLVIPTTFFVEKRIRDRRFCRVFHTSGSTGKAKEIVKTFESLAKEVAGHRDFYRRLFAQTDMRSVRFLATIDPSHMYGTLWRELLPQAMNCACDPEVILTPESLVAKMRAADKVFLVTTPSFLDRFTAYAGQYDVPQNCVEIVTSGALLTKDVSDRTKRVFGIEPRQIFGSTETGGVAWRRGDGPWQVLDAVRVKAVRMSSENGPTRLAVRSPYSFCRGWYVMGDGVELAPDGRSFGLLGRQDRLVKINEERINLAEMEEKVKELGFAECALAVLEGDRGPMLGAVLVVSASKAPPSALDLRKALLPVFPKGTVPKRFRLVQSMPRNAQGKVVRSEVVRLLESALVEPRMRDVVLTDDSFSAVLTFDPGAPYFQGHFPGFPILPGVAQLGLAERLAERLLGRSATLTCVKKMKFMHVVEPNVDISLRLVRKGESEVAYEFKRGEALCSSGVLQF